MAGNTTRPLVAARAVRGFADGFVSVLLAGYLHDLGLRRRSQIGIIVTATLVGSAALTLYAGLRCEPLRGPHACCSRRAC